MSQIHFGHSLCLLRHGIQLVKHFGEVFDRRLAALPPIVRPLEDLLLRVDWDVGQGGTKRR